ncbi:hypothetical protein [Idiomarina baltica]|uniref:hypothetical protein n=1 Tax=Idiomarina baltica TaxID=190892 RepID=UPI002FDD671E|tara:strand:+ start:1158 stop:1388 length:231 start_codon:yes stop_codon:yes gene_type:complete
MAKTNRKTFTLQQGCSVYHENHHFIVLQIVNLDYVLAENFQTKEILKLRISELSLNPTKPEGDRSSVIDALEDEDL